MEITEVRVALREGSEKRLKAYATLTFDNCFVVRNIKIIEGKNGLFVAMPSRKPKVGCGRCGFKGDLGGRFCTQCGASVPAAMERGPAASIRPPGSYESRAGAGEGSDAQSHRDIAHPITAEFRQYLQQKVLEAYETERAKGQSPGAPETSHVGDETA